MSRVLIVDDKEMMRDSVAATLARKGHTVIAASDGHAALEKLAKRRPDVVVTDLQMPGMDGLELLNEVRTFDEQLPVIFMTAYGTVETAVAALKRGAFDYITKPFSGDELMLAVERALEHAALLKENQILRAAARPIGKAAACNHAMIGSGECMSALITRLHMVADSHGTVLLTGESGSGKEVAAHWIHEHSPRSDAPFLAINCAALSTSLLESELFGHEKGAFTGADRLRKGRFELADGGTLLLDEISEIAPSIQAKLLRVLQEKVFERVGSSTSHSVDVRLIATSNRDLPAEVARETFREDLFFRLNVLPVELPPLRSRVEDIPELVQHFLKMVAEREGRNVKSVPREVIELLQTYDWPGNVRELQNICERAVVLTRSESIAATMIRPWLTGPIAPGRRQHVEIETKPNAVRSMLNTSSTGQLICDGGGLTLDIIEREAIMATLERNSGHRQKSAAALGIGVRTLGLKLKKWKDEKLIPEST